MKEPKKPESWDELTAIKELFKYGPETETNNAFRAGTRVARDPTTWSIVVAGRDGLIEIRDDSHVSYAYGHHSLSYIDIGGLHIPRAVLRWLLHEIDKSEPQKPGHEETPSR
jgi:hypothetical protein